jgi:hypothetical protein
MLVLIAAAVAVALSGASQEQPKTEPKTASNKNVIIVRGCLAGSMLTDAEARDYVNYVPDRMRITGNRAMRTQLREANGHYVEVTGALKGVSNAGTGALVKDTGKTKIYVGGTSRPRSDPTALDEPLSPPVLDVTHLTEISSQCSKYKS